MPRVSITNFSSSASTMTPSSEAICHTSLPVAGRTVLLGTHGNGGTAANGTLAGLFLFVAVFLRSQ
jgi:hypothetical protein